MKTCSRCGCQTVDEVKFCPGCGHAFTSPEQGQVFAQPVQTAPVQEQTAAPSVEEQPSAPFVQAPPPPVPPYTQAPPAGYYPPPAPPAKPKPPALAKSIVSMVLSINALEVAAACMFLVIYLALVFLLVGSFAADSVPYDEEIFVKGFFSGYMVIYSLILGGIGLAMGLVGRHLGLKAKEAGNQSKMAHFGVKLGNIAWILSAAAVAIAVFAAIIFWLI